MEQIALNILEKYPIHKIMPISLSGRNHYKNETQRTHLETMVKQHY